MTQEENDKYIKVQKEAIQYHELLLAGKAKWWQLVERIGNNHDKNSYSKDEVLAILSEMIREMNKDSE